MELKSMKLTRKESKESVSPIMEDGPQYPYGLRLHLDNDALEKLDLKSLPSVGEEMTITAKVRVVDVSESESLHGKHRSLGLQITDLALGAAKE